MHAGTVGLWRSGEDVDTIARRAQLDHAQRAVARRTGHVVLALWGGTVRNRRSHGLDDVAAGDGLGPAGVAGQIRGREDQTVTHVPAAATGNGPDGRLAVE